MGQITNLGWHQRTARRVASHPVVIVLCRKMNAAWVWSTGDGREIISASLTINIIERKRSWNRPVAYPMCRSVCLSVCLESVLWQNTKQLIGSGCRIGWWVRRSRDGLLDGGSRASRGREGFRGFRPTGLNGVFLTGMYSTRAWKVDNISVCTIYCWKCLFMGFPTI